MTPEQIATESEKWVYIGEVEMREEKDYNGRVGRDICPDGNEYKHFLLKRNYLEGCMYSILSTRRKINAWTCNPVYLDKDCSIFAILTFIVSNVSYPMYGDIPCKDTYMKRAIRFVGMENWIERNEEYSQNKISDEALEKSFESDRKDLDEIYKIK